MIQLTYSNRMEVLLQGLAERVQAFRQARGPWEPVPIVVPNPLMKAFVKEGLARTCGIAANLRFNYLVGLWTSLVPRDAFRVLTGDTLRSALLAVLADEALLQRVPFEPVRAYLGGDRGSLKTAQLATELARAFDEYQFTRPDWLDAWREDRPARDPGDHSAEAWQRALWREAVARLEATGLPCLPLKDVVRHPAFGRDGLPPAIHAFGLTHAAPVYHTVYRSLGERTDLHLYALNPCGEFWEDLTTVGERLWTKQARRAEARLGLADGETPEDPYRLESEGPEALRRWGRAGRENIRLLNEVSDCDFDPRFELPPGDHLLGRIQQDILRFEEGPNQGDREPDSSLQFLACPSARREAEVVASTLWELVEAHAEDPEPLGFSDIAVVVPSADLEGRLAHLQAAFQEAHDLPWTRVDGGLPVLLQTLEAVDLLLDLPTSGLTRAAVLRILSHPALLRRFPDLDPEAGSRWCDDLGIVRGADRNAWEGTYLDHDVLNWDQGLKRLGLGAFLGDGVDLALGGESYGIRGSGAEPSIGRFIALARGLIADAHHLESLRLDLPGWCETLDSYLTRWLEGDDEPAIRALQRVRAFLEDLRASVPAGLEAPCLDFSGARFLAGQSLERLRNDQPRNLARGVVVAPYEAIRGLPFRALVLMGLGEGVFPEPDTRNPMDLRAQRRRPGDVTSSEQQRYLFLEALLSARDHLVLTFVGLDDLTGERREPSSLFKGLRALAGRYLQERFAPSGNHDPLRIEHPLRRFDPSYFPQWFPEVESPLRTCSVPAIEEARALRLGRDLRAAGPLELPPFLDDLPAPPELRTLLQEALDHPGTGRTELPNIVRISLTDLTRWLECPLTGAAAVRLGLRSEDLEDRDRIEEEAFQTAFLESHRLQQEVAFACASEDTDPENTFFRQLAPLQRQGRAPHGLFAEAEWKACGPRIEAWVGTLRSQPHPIRRLRLGSARSRRAAADETLPPLRLEFATAQGAVRVELAGDLKERLGEAALFLERGAFQPKAGAKTRKRALRAFVDHLVLTASGREGIERGACFFFAGEDTPQAGHYAFQALSRDQAQARLAEWLRELLEGDHAVFLPIEAVLEGWEEQRLTAEDLRAFHLDHAREGYSTVRGPVPDPARFPPPPDPLDLARRRLGEFLEQTGTFHAGGLP